MRPQKHRPWRNTITVFLVLCTMTAMTVAFQTAPVLPKKSPHFFDGRGSACTPKLTARRTPTAMSPSSSEADFSSGFDSQQMDALVRRGKLEAELMQTALQGELLEPGTKSSASNDNIIKKKNTKKKKSKKEKRVSAAVAARALKQEGVVRLNGVLSKSTAATLREEVLERRSAAYAAIEGGDDWRQYFADVLLKSNRCDMLLPLKGNSSLQTALRELLLQGTLANILQSTLGEEATLYELSVLVSEPGSPRQPVHPDNPYQEHPPLITCFVALQDIRAEMGPTVFLPRTNTASAHAEFDDVNGDDVSKRDTMLTQRPNIPALLQAGDASLFDSRTMHCGGANDLKHGETRALFYVSFRNPHATEAIGNVGSIIEEYTRKPMSLRELRAKLALVGQDTDDNGNSVDPFDDVDDGSTEQSSQTEGYSLAVSQFNLGLSYQQGEGVEQDAVEAVRWFELASEQGLAAAQHSLGVCYSNGAGVTRDLERASDLFKLASGQGHPGAQTACDEIANELL